MKYKFYFPLLILAVFWSSCQNDGGGNISSSIYFWKTENNMNEAEASLFNEFGFKNVYLHYFDVDWSTAGQKAVPKGIISEWSEIPDNINTITPCIFLTNTVFEQATMEYIPVLAKKVSRKIMELDSLLCNHYADNIAWKTLKADENLAYGTPEYEAYQRKQDSIKAIMGKATLEKFKEVQIDCDWTEKSREHYFYFLREITKNLPAKKISCTLRLWQYKYRKMAGIPPVSRCMLMCYSTGNPREYGVKNSIATFESIKEYLNESSYDLPLDIALPIYSWGVLFRNKEFKGLLGEVSLQHIQKDTTTWRHLGNNLFMFKRDTVIGDVYLRNGDEIRVEQISSDDLGKIAEYISDKISLASDSKIALFSWNTIYINNYGKQNIKNILGKFN